MANGPTIARQHGENVLYDSRYGYHVTLTPVDLARLAAQASQELYLDKVCEGVVPVRTDPVVG